MAQVLHPGEGPQQAARTPGAEQPGVGQLRPQHIVPGLQFRLPLQQLVLCGVHLNFQGQLAGFQRLLAFVQLFIRLQGSPAHLFGEPVAALAQRLGNAVQLAQVALQPGHHAQRGHQIHRKQGRHAAQQRQPDLVGDRQHQLHHHRVHHPHHDGCADAPQNAEFQADVAAQIEGLVAVIPPGGVKQRFEGPAAHQLNEGGQQHSPRKQNQQVVLQRQQQGEHRRHAAAVNGAERPVQEAAVHQFAGVQRGVGHFGAPAQKCIDKKQPEQLINGEKMQLHGRNPSF